MLLLLFQQRAFRNKYNVASLESTLNKLSSNVKDRNMLPVNLSLIKRLIAKVRGDVVDDVDGRISNKKGKRKRKDDDLDDIDLSTFNPDQFIWD